MIVDKRSDSVDVFVWGVRSLHWIYGLLDKDIKPIVDHLVYEQQKIYRRFIIFDSWNTNLFFQNRILENRKTLTFH